MKNFLAMAVVTAALVIVYLLDGVWNLLETGKWNDED